MPAKQLSTAQIQALHKLVQRNAIKYYDVEVEIVDHYASAIEAIWEEEPELSFYQAQMRVYKEFWDFKGLEKEKMKQISLRAHQDAWKQIKDLFRWPKILELLFVFTSCWIVLYILKNIAWSEGIYHDIRFYAIIGLSIPQGYNLYALIKFKKKMNNYEFLSLWRISSTCSFFILFFYVSLTYISFTSLIPSAFIFAIFLISMKDSYSILKAEMTTLEKRFPQIVAS